MPVCFPQFGPWELGPQHGFARDSDKWKVEGSGVSVDAVTGDASVSQYIPNKKDQKPQNISEF